MGLGGGKTGGVAFEHIFFFVCTNLVGKLLTALLSGLSDRSSSVRKAHAKAIGYLIKVISVLLVLLV
jgi:hypothetical protein